MMIWAVIGLLLVVIIQNTVLLSKAKTLRIQLENVYSSMDSDNRHTHMYLARVLDNVRIIAEPIEKQVSDTIKRMYFEANKVNTIDLKED